MKLITIRKSLIATGILFTGLMISTSHSANAQETIVHDEIIDWDWERGSWYGGNTFYWWHRPIESDTVNYGDMSPTDWLSPYNYRNGEFFLRFEVISQPSDENFHIQFGIWQDYGKTGGYSETVSALADLNGGAGSLVETSIGIPRRWWQKRSDDPVDFRRPEDFYRIGILLWNSSPLCLPMAQGWNNDNACSDAETVALRFFPMKARVTVVAVAEGYNFSGWENYNNKPDTPDYTIDYGSERTLEEVPAEIEYSTNPEMSGAKTGNGEKILLTPGEDLYFRVKASGNNPASDIQHLEVPDRPEAPQLAITIDYKTEFTVESIPDGIEYSDNQDFNEVSQGNNTPIDFPPNTTIFFRKMASGNSFSSELLVVNSDPRPSAPKIGINYYEEVSDPIPANHIYSTNMAFSGYSEGDGSPVELNPGTSLFVKKIATDVQYASEIQELIVLQRPMVPSLTIDYTKETTVEPISSSLVYSDSPDMGSVETGNGEIIAVMPGSTLYFQIPASDSSFKSNIYEFDIPERPNLKLLVPEPVIVTPIPIEVQFPTEVSGFSTDDIQISNGTVDSIDAALTAFITPQSDGYIQLFIPPNVIDEGNFTSFSLRFQVQNVTGVKDLTNSTEIRIFPSPAANHIILYYEGSDSPTHYDILNLQAKVLRSGSIQERETFIPLDGMKSGIYFVTLYFEDNHKNYIKFIKD